MYRSEVIIDELMLKELEYLRSKYSIFSTDLMTDDVSLLLFASSRLWESTESMRSYDFYKLSDFDSDAIFLIAALTISLIFCCICCHVFNDNAIIMKDCEDLRDTNVLCLKSFSIISKSNWRRSEKCSDVSSVKDDSFFERRDFERLISLIEYMICSNRRTAS